MHGRIRALALAVVLSLGGGCSDGTGPKGLSREDLLRTYTATQFQLSRVGDPGSVLDRLTTSGLLVRLTLHEDGTTSGIYVESNFISFELDGTFTFDAAASRLTLAIPNAEGFPFGEMSYDVSRTKDGISLRGEVVSGDHLEKVTLTATDAGSGGGTGTTVTRDDLLRVFTTVRYETSPVADPSVRRDERSADDLRITLRLHADGKTTGLYETKRFGELLDGTFQFDAPTSAVRFGVRTSAKAGVEGIVFHAVRSGKDLLLEGEGLVHPDTLARVSYIAR